MFIHIVSEPIFESYKTLIDYAFKKSKSFLLHIPEDLRVDDSVNEVLKEMKDFLIDIVPSYSFEYTDHGVRGEVYLYECNDHTRKVIRNKVTGLYDWCLPQLPEDLSFIDETGEAWFTTISHERMGGMISEDLNVIEELKEIMEIKVNR